MRLLRGKTKFNADDAVNNTVVWSIYRSLWVILPSTSQNIFNFVSICDISQTHKPCTLTSLVSGINHCESAPPSFPCSCLVLYCPALSWGGHSPVHSKVCVVSTKLELANKTQAVRDFAFLLWSYTEIIFHVETLLDQNSLSCATREDTKAHASRWRAAHIDQVQLVLNHIITCLVQDRGIWRQRTEIPFATGSTKDYYS